MELYHYVNGWSRARQRHDIFTPCVLSFLIECHHTLHFADKSQTSSMNWGKSRTCVSRKVDPTCFPAAVLAHGSSQPAMSVSRVWRCSISTANRVPRSLPKSKCDDPDHCQIAGGWGNPATSQGNRRYARRTKHVLLSGGAMNASLRARSEVPRGFGGASYKRGLIFICFVEVATKVEPC